MCEKKLDDLGDAVDQVLIQHLSPGLAAILDTLWDMGLPREHILASEDLAGPLGNVVRCQVAAYLDHLERSRPRRNCCGH